MAADRGFYAAPPVPMAAAEALLRPYGVRIALAEPLWGVPYVWRVVPARGVGRVRVDRSTRRVVVRLPGMDMTPWALHLLNNVLFPGIYPPAAIPWELDPYRVYYGHRLPRRWELVLWNVSCALMLPSVYLRALIAFLVREGYDRIKKEKEREGARDRLVPL